MPPPLFAPPWPSGSFGRSRYSCRGQKSETRSRVSLASPEFFGLAARMHGELRQCLEENHRAPLVLMGASLSSAVAGNTVAGVPPLCCYLSDLICHDLAGVAPINGKRKWRRSCFSWSRRRSWPETPPATESISGCESQRSRGRERPSCYSNFLN